MAVYEMETFEMLTMGICVTASELLVSIVDESQVPFSLVFKDTWKVRKSGAQRCADYAEYRTRLRETIVQNKVSGVGVSALEAIALKGRSASMAMFDTAELRGVALEAATSTGVDVRKMNKAALGKVLGQRKASEYADDDAYFANEPKLAKKYRDSILLAVGARG